MIAAAFAFGMTACNGNKVAEETVDTNATECCEEAHECCAHEGDSCCNHEGECCGNHEGCEHQCDGNHEGCQHECTK